MKPYSSTNGFYNLGKRLGQPVAWVLRAQQNMVCWLVKKGCPYCIARGFQIIANLLIMAMFVYLSSGVIVVIGITLLLLTMLTSKPRNNEDSNGLEWEYGPQGYGLYTRNGLRVDGGEEENK